jgi:hypothetical protein
MLLDVNKSLEQLEGDDWGEPNYDSHLVIECHRLRRVPLREFTAENFRIMIGQQIGLRFLVPLALDLLRSDCFIAGDYYAGDLLAAALRVDGVFWREHPDLRRQANEIVERAFALLPSLDECDRRTAEKALTEAHRIFESSESTTA